MGLSQADAARRLNVSRSVVQRLWDQYQSEDSVSRRPVPGRPRATTPAEDRFLALSARREEPLLCRSSLQTTFKHQEEKNLPLLRCEIVFTMQVCMQEDQLCAFPQRTTAKEPLMLGKTTCFLDSATMSFCAVHELESDLQWK
ncbi:transposable element Tcb2 transposase [Trichonephila clavipes]|nr:transposable element Tcb2 transposase [Trichonephila clavipes]